WYSDMGWMVGPMGVCAPLMLGGALVLYDGGPTVPDAAALLRLAIEAGVTHFGSSPTLLRAMRAAFGGIPADARPRLQTMMVAGEVIDEETFRWAQREIARDAPIINYTGGTEVSGGIFFNVLTRPIVPVAFNAANMDVMPDVVNDKGESVVG